MKSKWCRGTFSSEVQDRCWRTGKECIYYLWYAHCKDWMCVCVCVCARAFSIDLPVVRGERQIRMDEISSWFSRPSSLRILDGGKVEICCYFLSFIRQLISWLLSACLASIVQGLHSGCLATSLPPVQSLLLSPCAMLTPPYTSAGGAKRKISVYDLKRKCS